MSNDFLVDYLQLKKILFSFQNVTIG